MRFNWGTRPNDDMRQSYMVYDAAHRFLGLYRAYGPPQAVDEAKRGGHGTATDAVAVAIGFDDPEDFE